MNTDVIIIGGGVIGFSTALQLLQNYSDINVIVLEKENEAAMHQTGHNSGVIHAGVYYTPNSLKAQFCYTGSRETKKFCKEYGIPFREPGKLIVATDELELMRMQDLIKRCEQNGLNYSVLNELETQKLQPGLRGIGSIYVADTGIVDWKSVTKQYAECFKQLGGEIFFNQKVIGIRETNTNVIVKTANNIQYHAEYVITCAGLYADHLVKMTGKSPHFKIMPFRGEYYQLSEKYTSIIKHLIYPVPDPALPFLGVHFTPQINNTVTVGPNAVLALTREGYDWSRFKLKDAMEILTFMPTWKLISRNFKATCNEFRSSLSKQYYLQRLRKYYPDMVASDLRAYPAGVRAQAINNAGKLIDDFLFVKTNRILHTCNAPSPAATSSLPIGRYIVEQFKELFS